MLEKKITIITPFYNEENTLSGYFQSLLNQKDQEGHFIDSNLYQLIMVNNNSTDGSIQFIEAFKETHPEMTIHLIHEVDKGVIPARIAGFNHAINNPSIEKTAFLASMDADTLLHEHWMITLLNKFENTDADILSFAGCFPDEFWRRIPRTTKKFAQEVGTIFFNQETIDAIKNENNRYLLTEKIFFDFNRFITDTCYAIRRNVYEGIGGYKREFYDAACTQEVFGEGWRMMFRLERSGAKLLYVNEAPYYACPRRMLKEPHKFLSGESYSVIMADVRGDDNDLDEYAVLENMSETIDFGPVKRRYVIEYYILLRSILRPEYVINNQDYFSDIKDELYQKIINWWEVNQEPAGKEVFEFGKQLGDLYADKVLSNIIDNQLVHSFMPKY